MRRYLRLSVQALAARSPHSPTGGVQTTGPACVLQSSWQRLPSQAVHVGIWGVPPAAQWSHPCGTHGCCQCSTNSHQGLPTPHPIPPTVRRCPRMLRKRSARGRYRSTSATCVARYASNYPLHRPPHATMSPLTIPEYRQPDDTWLHSPPVNAIPRAYAPVPATLWMPWPHPQYNMRFSSCAGMSKATKANRAPKLTFQSR